MIKWLMPVFIEAYKDIDRYGKEVEGRVPDPSKPEKDYGKIKVEDVMVFRAVDKNIQPIEGMLDIKFPVTFNRKYATLVEMLRAEGIEKLLPGVTNLRKGEQIYLSFPEYAKRVRMQGVYAIGLGKRLE